MQTVLVFTRVLIRRVDRIVFMLRGNEVVDFAPIKLKTQKNSWVNRRRFDCLLFEFEATVD